MLDEKGFDLWADGYDRTVGVSDEENTYPFAGYREVLGTVYRMVMEKPQATVLDIGFGTAVLTAKLYEHGCTIYGQDFSSRMMELAAEKMPEAHLFQGDFSQGLAEPLRRQRYDYIVATYSLHHLTDGQKIDFLRILQSRLNGNGRIVIGDVAFETRAELDQCRQKAGSEWDEEEIYFVADELRKFFPNLSFTRVSYCAGVLVLPGKPMFAREVPIPVDETNIHQAAAIHAIAWQASHRAFCTPDFVEQHTQEHQREYLQSKINGGTKVYMMEDEQPVGIVSVTGSLIEDLYVLPEMQNRGYGTALLQFAIRQCTDTPVLWILENNPGAERLYLRMGFQKTGKRNRIADGLDEIEMRLAGPSPLVTGGWTDILSGGK